MLSRKPRAAAAWLLVILALLGAGSAGAYEFTLIPSIEGKEEYNDNVYLATRGDQALTSDFITTFSPQLETAWKSERLDLSFLGRINQRYYSRDTSLNHTDQVYTGKFRWMASPLLSFSGKADYIEDSRPDRDILTSGLVLTAAIRHRQVYNFTQDWTLNETNAMRVSFDYLKDRYEQPSTFTDMESKSGSLSFIHDLSYMANNTKMLLNFGYANYSFTGTEIENYTGTAGLMRQINELWSLNFNAGVRYTYSRFNYAPLPFIEAELTRTYGLGGMGQLGLTYKGEKTDLNFAFSRDLAPAYGQVGATERTMFSLMVKRRLTYELSGIFNGYYFWNKSDRGDFSPTNIDTESFTVGPTLRYDMTKDFFLETSYMYTKVQNNASSTSADRNLFMFRFVLQHPLFQ